MPSRRFILSAGVAFGKGLSRRLTAEEERRQRLAEKLEAREYQKSVTQEARRYRESAIQEERGHQRKVRVRARERRDVREFITGRDQLAEVAGVKGYSDIADELLGMDPSAITKENLPDHRVGLLRIAQDIIGRDIAKAETEEQEREEALRVKDEAEAEIDRFEAETARIKAEATRTKALTAAGKEKRKFVTWEDSDVPIPREVFEEDYLNPVRADIALLEEIDALPDEFPSQEDRIYYDPIKRKKREVEVGDIITQEMVIIDEYGSAANMEAERTRLTELRNKMFRAMNPDTGEDEIEKWNKILSKWMEMPDEGKTDENEE